MVNSVVKKKERLAWMDALKLFAIFLVVFGHTVSNYCLDEGRYGFSNPVRLYIYAFHMPLFMTISGFFSASILKDGGNILRRFKSLIVPCITLFFIFALFHIVTGIGIQNLWYLKSLFICYAITALSVRLFRNYSHLINRGGYKLMIISCLAICMMTVPILLCRIPVIGMYKVDWMLPYFLLGIAIHRCRILIGSRKFLCLWTFLFIAGILIWQENYVWYLSQPAWFHIKEIIMTKQLMFDADNFISCLIRMLVGAVGSLFFISLFSHLNENRWFNKLFTHLGKWGMFTLHVYILQTFIVQMNIFGIYLPSSDMVLFNFIYSPLTALVVTALCVALAMFMEKNVYINRYIFGKF